MFKLIITGQMSEKDAGIVRKYYALAAVLWGLAAFIAAVSLWFR